MTYNYYKEFHINWFDMEHIKLSHEDFNKKYQELKSNREEITEKTDIFAYLDQTTFSKSEDRGLHLMKLYLREDETYRVYLTDYYDNNKNDTSQHVNAAKYINNRFTELHNGLTLRKVFGYTPYEIKNCIPRELHWVNKNYLSYNKNNYFSWMVSGIDACSQYPSNICGKLPNYKNSKLISGTVKPTKEYPFAFYIKSGFIAEFNKYDTHDWVNHELKDRLFYTNEAKKEAIRLKKWDANKIITLEDKLEFIKDPNKDVTLLMAECDYELTDIFSELYLKRKENNDYYKRILNASIGSFHTRKYECYKLAHLAAVTIARSNYKMIDLINKIGTNNIIQVCVDGIIYLGRETYGVNQKEKGLGLFEQEFVGCNIVITNENQYIVQSKSGDIVKYKHAGYNYDDETGELMDETYSPTSLLSIFHWIRIDPLEQIKLEFIKEQ